MANDLLDKLAQAVENYDASAAESMSKQTIEAYLDPVEAIERGLARGLRSVGEKFGRGELFLAHLVAAAEAMQAGIKVLEPEMARTKKSLKSLGRVVIGTVEGDIHDIGKSIVAAMLRASGFEVADLGVDVPADTFVNKAKERKADLVGMSALLTTTVLRQADVMKALREANFRDKIKVMIGGAAVTKDWAKKIGADGYAEDAITAVSMAKELLGIR